MYLSCDYFSRFFNVFYSCIYSKTIFLFHSLMYYRVQCITTAIVTTWYNKYSFDVMLIIILGEIRNWQFSALQNQIHSTQHNHSYKNKKRFVLKESTYTMVELTTYEICIGITNLNIISFSIVPITYIDNLLWSKIYSSPLVL